MNLALTLLVGLLAGTHAATWGMYKDAIHEGFTYRKYLRSVCIAGVIALLVQRAGALDATRASDLVLLFGASYVLERAVAEVYKTFLRNENQAKYTIPMQFAVGGRVVRGRAIRYAAGVAYVAGAGLAMVTVAALQLRLSRPPSLMAVLLLGTVGGWISALGGAWKDAPIEGFQIFKFFRSPLLTMGFAFLLSQFTSNLLAIALAATGYTIATTETYKTFFFPSVPRGKFAGKPILFPAMLRQRQRFIPLYAGIWLAVLGTFAIALIQSHQRAVMQLWGSVHG